MLTRNPAKITKRVKIYVGNLPVTPWDPLELMGLTVGSLQPSADHSERPKVTLLGCSLEGGLWTEILSYREGRGEIPPGALMSLLASPDYPDPDPEWLPRSHAIMALSRKSVHTQADTEPPYELTVRTRGHVGGEQVGTRTKEKTDDTASRNPGLGNGLMSGLADPGLGNGL